MTAAILIRQKNLNIYGRRIYIQSEISQKFFPRKKFIKENFGRKKIRKFLEKIPAWKFLRDNMDGKSQKKHVSFDLGIRYLLIKKRYFFILLSFYFCKY